MPRRRDERARVLGPTWIPSKSRWRVVVITPKAARGDGRPDTRWFVDEEEANEFVAVTTGKLEKLSGTTLKQAIGAYEQHLAAKGTIGSGETLRRLRLFFPDLSMLIGRVTPERAQGYYDAFRVRLLPNGDPISVSYHRAALINSRSMFKWAVKQGLVRANPFAEVEGLGRKSAGKTQLTGDETRRFYAYCMARAQGGDEAALGVLLLLTMALRSSDVTRRVVRDVDLDATVLRVGVGGSAKGKNERSNRPRRIPAVLQPIVQRLVTGRSPSEPLFAAPGAKDGHHTRRWLEQAMDRFCASAGVTRVCPHSLKGTAGTLAAEMGTLADQIADHLSHDEQDTTRRHYVAGGALEAAEAARALKVIVGGRR